MARISRHELKKDQFVTTMAGGWAWVEHKHTALIVAAVVAVVALGGFTGYRVYAENQMAKADAALGQAIRTYHAPIVPPGQPKPPTDEAVYSNEKARSEAALQEFTGIRDKYPRTPAAHMAEYYIALCQEALGRKDESEKTLERLAAGRDREVRALAKLRLAGLYLKRGKAAEAVKIYRELAAQPTLLVPKPVPLMALADHYRDTQPGEAAKIYDELKRDYPDSRTSGDAEDRLKELPRP